MKNVELSRLGLAELVELKRRKEQSLYTLGFRLASRGMFDYIVEIEKEIELRVEQIKTMLSSGQSLKFVEIDMEVLVPGWDCLVKDMYFQEWCQVEDVY